MRQVSDRFARRHNMRVICPPTTARSLLEQYERQTGRQILSQLEEAMRPYSGDRVKIVRFQPVPRPDYEAEYGGPYSHIIETRYNKRWGCVFGLTTEGKIVLWMD